MVLDAIDKPGPSTVNCSFPHFLPPSPRKKGFTVGVCTSYCPSIC